MKPTYQPEIVVTHVTPASRETLTSWISRMVVEVMLEVKATQEAQKLTGEREQ